jgi:predicted helicase
MTGIAIAILVKKKSSQKNNIFYYDIGKNKTKREKLSKLTQLQSIKKIIDNNDFKKIEPDQNYDWINKGDINFSKFISIGEKRGALDKTIFENFSNGLVTSRDSWCYNSSKKELINNIKRTINFYNGQVDKIKKEKKNQSDVKNIIDTNPLNISWSRSLINNASKLKKITFDENKIRLADYRPFLKQFVYFDEMLNEVQGQNRLIFPKNETRNLSIVITGVGSESPFSCLCSNHLCDFIFLRNSQCFPLKLYSDDSNFLNEGLFSGANIKDQNLTVKDGITDYALKYFIDHFQNKKITKEDIFYYIYSLLHSIQYRAKYKNNLIKELPRIPILKKFEDFKLYVEGGKELSRIHTDYESVSPYPVTIVKQGLKKEKPLDDNHFYKLEKMKFVGFGKNKDKTQIIYNNFITIKDIPIESYEYLLAGKPAIDWVVDRQGVSKDNITGIVNDTNIYAREVIKNPAYPLELLQKVINVSLHTMKIVKNLPDLKI